MVKKISEAEFEQVKEEAAAVIDFSANWCGPCKMLAPILEEISEEMQGKVSFYTVDVDENPGLAQQFQVSSIPNLVFLKKGEPAGQQVGFVPKEMLNQWIQSLL
ncbi:MAG: thioredoxin [Eubacterium sp.]|nr:thioredoxin [Eubacterium sp.]